MQKTRSPGLRRPATLLGAIALADCAGGGGPGFLVPGPQFAYGVNVFTPGAATQFVGFADDIEQSQLPTLEEAVEADSVFSLPLSGGVFHAGTGRGSSAMPLQG